MLLVLSGDLTTEEGLGIVLLVQDDTKGGRHVDGVTVGVVEQIVSRVDGSVAVAILQGKLLGRGVGVERRGILRGEHSTLPGLGGHELLTFTLLLNLKGIIVSVVLVSGVTRLVEGLLLGIITLGLEVVATIVSSTTTLVLVSGGCTTLIEIGRAHV